MESLSEEQYLALSHDFRCPCCGPLRVVLLPEAELAEEDDGELEDGEIVRPVLVCDCWLEGAGPWAVESLLREP